MDERAGRITGSHYGPEAHMVQGPRARPAAYPTITIPLPHVYREAEQGGLAWLGWPQLPSPCPCAHVPCALCCVTCILPTITPTSCHPSPLVPPYPAPPLGTQPHPLPLLRRHQLCDLGRGAGHVVGAARGEQVELGEGAACSTGRRQVVVGGARGWDGRVGGWVSGWVRGGGQRVGG